MSAEPAAKRARAPALDAVVSTLAVPGLGRPNGLFVLEDGTRLACAGHTLRVVAPSGLLPALTLAGRRRESGKQDGPGADARFNYPRGITVDPAGQTVVADSENHALRFVSKAGAVSTLAGGGEPGFADGQGAAARFNHPHSVVVLPDSGEFVVSDHLNNALRVVTPAGGVRTLAGSGQPGFADGQGAAARFNGPAGLALDADGSSVLVADAGNHAVRRVTMAGVVSTVAGNGEAGFADGEGAAARFHRPAAVVADKEGTIVVADKENHRLRKIRGGQVTTLAGGSEAGAADGAGAGARFKEPIQLALDERGRVLVKEVGREDTLRVVEAGLAPPAWMGPVDPEAAAAARAHKEETLETEKLKEDYAKLKRDLGKLVGASELADVVLVVEGEFFPAHRAVLTARSEYFRGLLLSGMQEGGGQQEIALGEVSAGAFRVVLQYLYTAELPAWEDLQDAGKAAEDDGAAGGSGRRGGKGGKAKGKHGDGSTGEGGAAAAGLGEGAAGCHGLVREVLKAADMLQAEGLLKHCLEAFREGMTVHSAIEHLVWAHTKGPEEARGVAMAYVVQHYKAIQGEARKTMDLLETLPAQVAVQIMKLSADYI